MNIRHIYIHTHTIAFKHALTCVFKYCSIFFWVKVIIVIYYNLHFFNKKIKQIKRIKFRDKQ